MCREFPRSQDPRATQIQFPLSSFQKQRNSRENQGRTSPQANTAAAATPTSLSHTHTHSMAMCTHSYPVELMVYMCAWRVCYLAQIHNSQPCLSLLLLLTIARQQSAATHIEYCATASRCLGQPGHPHLSSLSTPTPPNLYDSDMKRVIYSRGSLTMSTRATRLPLESRQTAERRLQDGCEGNMMMCNKCIISCSLFREFGVMDSR